MTWWDSHTGRYRSTLVHKVFYVWGWPLARWAMFQMPSETAHHFGIRAILWIDRINTAWCWLVFIPHVFWLLLVDAPISALVRAHKVRWLSHIKRI